MDEFGTPSLEIGKEGVTQLFICTSVLFRPADIDTATKQIKQIQKDHFGGAEIRSSSVRGKKEIQRRLKILGALSKITFSYYALVVDKTRIHKESGLAYRQSFFRFFHRMLCRRLTVHGIDISIVADRLGDHEFMEGFREYIDKHVGPDLFTTFKFSFSDYQDDPLLQVADFISGTLGKMYDPGFKSKASDKYRELLEPKRIAENVWPPYWARDYTVEDSQEPSANRWDSEIAKACLNKVRTFMTGTEYTDLETREMQRIVLDRLLQHRLLGGEGRESVHSDDLIRMLNDCGFHDLSKPKFTSQVIGGLRDKGIILAGTSAGYRLAITYADIQDYLNHAESVISPMLSRLARAQETVKIATHNELDILCSPQHTVLGGLVELAEDNKFHVQQLGNEVLDE